MAAGNFSPECYSLDLTNNATFSRIHTSIGNSPILFAAVQAFFNVYAIVNANPYENCFLRGHLNESTKKTVEKEFDGEQTSLNLMRNFYASRTQFGCFSSLRIIANCICNNGKNNNKSDTSNYCNASSINICTCPTVENVDITWQSYYLSKIQGDGSSIHDVIYSSAFALYMFIIPATIIDFMFDAGSFFLNFLSPVSNRVQRILSIKMASLHCDLLTGEEVKEIRCGEEEKRKILFIPSASVVAITMWKRRIFSRVASVLLMNLVISNLAFAILRLPLQAMSTIFMAPFPWVISNPWWLADLTCKLFHITREWSMISTVYTLALVGYERYQAVYHPFHHHLSCKRVCKYIIGIWLLSLCIATPAGLVNGAILGPHAFGYLPVCDSLIDQYSARSQQNAYYIYQLVIAITQFFLPSTIISATYFKVLTTLKRRSSNVNSILDADFEDRNLWDSSRVRAAAQLRHEKSLLSHSHRAMMFCCCYLFAFVLLWGPLQITLTLQSVDMLWPGTFSQTLGTKSSWNDDLMCLYDAIASLCAFLNPLLYCGFSRNWLNDIRQVFTICLTKVRLFSRSSATRLTTALSRTVSLATADVSLSSSSSLASDVMMTDIGRLILLSRQTPDNVGEVLLAEQGREQQQENQETSLTPQLDMTDEHHKMF